MPDKVGSIKSPASSDQFIKYFREYLMEKQMDKSPAQAKIPGEEIDEGMPEEHGFDKLIKLAQSYASGGEKAAKDYIASTKAPTSVSPPHIPETPDKSITSITSKSSQGAPVDMPGMAKARNK
jgi:hypothetical protein